MSLENMRFPLSGKDDDALVLIQELGGRKLLKKGPRVNPKIASLWIGRDIAPSRNGRRVTVWTDLDVALKDPLANNPGRELFGRMHLTARDGVVKCSWGDQALEVFRDRSSLQVIAHQLSQPTIFTTRQWLKRQGWQHSFSGFQLSVPSYTAEGASEEAFFVDPHGPEERWDSYSLQTEIKPKLCDARRRQIEELYGEEVSIILMVSFEGGQPVASFCIGAELKTYSSARNWEEAWGMLVEELQASQAAK